MRKIAKGKQTELICSICNNNFLKNLSDYKVNQKVGRRTFCSKKCSGIAYSEIKLKYARSCHTNFDYLRKKKEYKPRKSREDEWSGFRYHLSLINKRKSKLREKLTLQDLKDLWIKQNGKCIYTNISLNLMKFNVKHHKEGYPYYTLASIDRIDSSQGYSKDNIQFISLAINYMKHKYPKEQTLEFLDIIRYGGDADIEIGSLKEIK